MSRAGRGRSVSWLPRLIRCLLGLTIIYVISNSGSLARMVQPIVVILYTIIWRSLKRVVCNKPFYLNHKDTQIFCVFDKKNLFKLFFPRILTCSSFKITAVHMVVWDKFAFTDLCSYKLGIILHCLSADSRSSRTENGLARLTEHMTGATTPHQTTLS